MAFCIRRQTLKFVHSDLHAFNETKSAFDGVLLTPLQDQSDYASISLATTQTAHAAIKEASAGRLSAVNSPLILLPIAAFSFLSGILVRGVVCM